MTRFVQISEYLRYHTISLLKSLHVFRFCSATPVPKLNHVMDTYLHLGSICLLVSGLRSHSTIRRAALPAVNTQPYFERR
jgi:hypothetical protein